MKKIFLAFFIFYLIACSSEQANSNPTSITPLAPLPPATPLPAKSPLPAITPLPALQPIPASTYLPTDTQIPTSTPLPIATPISQYDSVIFPEDYSDDPNNPTDLGYIESDLYILNEFGDNNRDYVLFSIKENFYSDSIKLLSYKGEDKIAFFAIEANNKFTANDDISKMIAYGHFGPDSEYNKIDENILYYSSNLDSPREEVILEPGDYVFRIQQGNNENASYIFVIELSKKSKY